MVGLGRLELPTSRLSSARSNQLSYRPDIRAKKAGQALIKGAPAKQGSKTRNDKHVFRLLNLEGIRGRRTHPSADPLLSNPDIRPGRSSMSKSNIQRLDKPNLTRRFLRKEVIQPQVPLRLPCYDFTPVADPTVVGCLLAVSAPASGRTNSHGVTGGVYKARERIHRGMLIRDY